MFRRIARTLSDHIIVKNFDEYEREGAGRYSLRREDRDALDRHLGRQGEGTKRRLHPIVSDLSRTIPTGDRCYVR
jgi:hypothetical protein